MRRMGCRQPVQHHMAAVAVDSVAAVVDSPASPQRRMVAVEHHVVDTDCGQLHPGNAAGIASGEGRRGCVVVRKGCVGAALAALAVG